MFKWIVAIIGSLLVGFVFGMVVAEPPEYGKYKNQITALENELVGIRKANAPIEAFKDSLEAFKDSLEAISLKAREVIEENVAMTNDYCHGITKMSKTLKETDLSESGKWGAMLMIYQELNDTYCSDIHRIVPQR